MPNWGKRPRASDGPLLHHLQAGPEHGQPHACPAPQASVTWVAPPPHHTGVRGGDPGPAARTVAYAATPDEVMKPVLESWFESPGTIMTA